MELVVARVVRAHGLRGEVVLDVRTDSPAERLAVGAELRTDRAERGVLTVTSAREHQGRLLVTFEQVVGRDEAERLRGTELVVEADASDEDDAWYPHELRGLGARRPDGRPLGTVEGIEHLPAHDALVLRETGGERTLVPFVRQIVPAVDVVGGYVVIDPPGGLLAADAMSDDDGDAQPSAPAATRPHGPGDEGF